MIIRCVWKDCRFCDADAYWLECTEQEANAQIFPLLNDEEIARSRKYAEGSEDMAESMGNPGHTFCFLISADMSFIRPFWVHYPIANLWNAYSPFEEIDKIELTDVSKIETLIT